MTDQASQLRELVESTSGLEWGGTGTVLPPSMPTGVVSYGPPPPRRRTGQRKSLRRVELAHAIAVCSGKGGVGKSNIAVNLAVILSGFGLKVCLLDGDLGLANADVLCNVTAKLTLEHVVTGRCRLSESMLLAPGGFRLIPGASGVAGMANLDTRRRHALLEQLATLERVADMIVIDCGAGISTNVIAFAAAANTVLAVTTPEPTAMTDAYGMIKTLINQRRRSQVELVVNMAGGDDEARRAFARMNRVSQTFLKRSLAYAGAIPTDPVVVEAVRQRVPFVLYAPDGEATGAMRRLAHHLVGIDDDIDDTSGGGEGFFTRVASWFGAGKKRSHSAGMA